MPLQLTGEANQNWPDTGVKYWFLKSVGLLQMNNLKLTVK